MQKACFMNARATRNQIVEAADQLFYEQGFEHTSFSDIAETVQISRGNFYYHFKSKDEILDAVIGCRLANTRSWKSGRRTAPGPATGFKVSFASSS